MTELCVVTYEDAAYSFDTESCDDPADPRIMKSVGYIEEETDAHVRLALHWRSEPIPLTEKGIVIPKAAILSMIKIPL